MVVSVKGIIDFKVLIDMFVCILLHVLNQTLKLAIIFEQRKKISEIPPKVNKKH